MSANQPTTSAIDRHRMAADQAMRAAFERWMIETAKIVLGSRDPYPAGLERDYWQVWQAAWLASASAADRRICDALERHGDH